MRKGKKKEQVEQPKEDDLKYIFYFYRPQLVESLWQWELSEGQSVEEFRKPASQVFAKGNYTYALIGAKNDVYSWGFGENYVLGNRDDCNQFTPYKLDPRMFEEKKVIMMSLGTMHTVALAHDGESAEGSVPQLDEAILEQPEILE